MTVVAEAGIGKSRLLDEFEAWAEARPESYIISRGRANPQTSSQPYGLLRDTMAWRFQISDDDSIEEARAKVESGVVHLFEHDDGSDLAEGRAHLLGHLIGIDWQDSRHVKGMLGDPKLIRNRAFDTAAQIFRRIGASVGSPVVLQLENLHWADDESLDFLNYLTEFDQDMPLLVLASTRPTLFERRTDWRGTESMRQRIDLAPLDKTDSRMLANELLKKLPEIPAALRELVTSSSEGNPFYMEELISMLIDQGAIQTGESWKVDAERLLVTQVPPTLTGVLQARLDQLPAPEKRALQQASVVGSVFWDQALLSIDARAAEQLPSLVQRELTLPQAGMALDGLREYAFRHQMLHQVTYDTVLKRARREWHGKVAQWLADLSAQQSLRAGDFLGAAAEHFEQAGDEPNAAEFHARAAEDAVRRFAHEHVLLHVDRALALLGEATPDALLAQAELRWRLLVARVRVLGLQAQRDEEAADLAAMDQLADLLADDQRRADVAWRRSLRAMRMGNWAEEERYARQSLACATRAGDDFLQLRGLRLVAVSRLLQGDIEAGRAFTLQALDHARSRKLRGIELRGIEAMLLDNLAFAAGREGDWVAMLDLMQQCLAIHRETGDRVSEAIALMNQGVGWMALGDLEQGRRDLDAALHMLRANGQRDMEGAALGELSRLALWQGDETRALSLARSALEIAEATKARVGEVKAMLRLGDAELSLGRLGAAVQAYTRARARALEIDSPRQFDACAGLARVALAEGNVSAALAAVQPVLDHVAIGGELKLLTDAPTWIELTCHQVLACAGDPHATQWLARAHAALMTEADAISDASLRKGYLHNVPFHREVVVAWSKRSTSSP